MVRLVALDVDGTLIGKDLKIPPATRGAIAAARARGVRFVIVTGRMYQSAVPFAKELELEDGPLVAYNGALTKEYPSGRQLYHTPVPVETARALAAYCEAHRYHLQAYVDDELYTPDMGKITQEYLQLARVKAHPVGSLFLWLQQPSTKLLISDEAHRIPQIQREIQTLLGPTVEIASSVPQFLEVVAQGISKGKALAEVARSMGVEQAEVMAIGDGMNDLSMVTWAGTGVAINHAPEALRRAAECVTLGGPGDGVAEALERFVLI